jgi:hypothetical protein
VIKDQKPKARKAKTASNRKPLRAVPLKAVLFTTKKQANDFPAIPS